MINIEAKEGNIMKKLLLTSCVVIAIICTLGSVAKAEEVSVDSKAKADIGQEKDALNGWHKENGFFYYYKDDVRQKEWQWIDGEFYYLWEESGVMITGWKKYENNWYHLSRETGVMDRGWKLIDGSYYYLRADSGKMITGEHKIDGVEYKFGPSGNMLTGWHKDENQKYEFYDENGAKIKEGWQKDWGSWYYLNVFGNLTTGLDMIGDHFYRFDDRGVMLTGWIGYENPVKDIIEYSYAAPNGILYENEWLQDDGNWYYFDTTRMVTGTYEVDGVEYYFADNGVMQ